MSGLAARDKDQTMHPPIVRAARKRDLTEIRALVQALSAFHGDRATITLSGLQAQFFDGGPARAFLAESGDRIVGYAAIMPHTRIHTGALTCDVQHLYVIETHRGRGIGKALLAAAQEHATKAGAFRLTIGTDPANVAAQAAYRALGWTEITGAGPRFEWPIAPG